jgi:DNA-binding response OmpR family regulator
MTVKVHIVEDEKKLNTMIADYLNALEYTVISSYDGVGAIRMYREENPDIVILDFMLPGLDGIDFLRKIRETDDTPVIMLTARAEESDKLIGLDTGADDYMTKPFSMKELEARIRALLRRTGKGRDRAGKKDTQIIAYGGLKMDESKRLVEKDGRQLKLTSAQFDILNLFLKNPGRVFSRLELLEAFQEVAVKKKLK